MARPKSLIVSMEITTVGRAHDCRSNDKHRLEKGMRRLTVKEDGDERHYCLPCARNFLQQSIDKLHHLLAGVNALDG